MNGNELTKRELEPYPRGKRGSARNMFRMVLWDAFRNFYSAKREPMFGSRQAVLDWCIEFMRQRYPGFEPGVV